MAQFDRPYLVVGLCYGVLGMTLGIYMASSQNHGQAVTHAHLLLVGFLLSVLYAVIHRLWLSEPNRLVAKLQFFAHHTGVIVLVSSLFALFGGLVSPAMLDPFLAISSLLVLVALILMLFMVVSRRTVSVGARSTA